MSTHDEILVGARAGGAPDPAPSFAPLDAGRAPEGRDLRRVLLTLDALAVTLAWVLAVGLDVADAPLVVVPQVALLVIASLWSMAAQRLYRSRVCSIRADEISRVLRAMVVVALVCLAAASTPALDLTPATTVVGTALATVLVVLVRGGFRSWLADARRAGRYTRPVVLVGTNDEAADLVDLMSLHPELGFSVAAVVGDRTDAMGHGLGSMWQGHTGTAIDVVQRTGATGALVVSSALASAELNSVVRRLLDVGAHVHLSHGIRGIDHRRLRAMPLAYEPLYYVEPASLAAWQLRTKRALDLVLATVGIIVASPALAAAAVAIKLHDRGPVLFSQTRVGQGGRHFRILKLRTMVTDAEERLQELHELNQRSGPLFKLERDPRVTPVGRLLRLTSLDELPQLINVLKGEMSLVGPRPALPKEVEAFDDELAGRSQVLPGVTGLWQMEARDNPSFAIYRRLDMFYVENWSVMLDLVILLATVETELARVVRALTGRRRAEALPAGAMGLLD